MSETTHDGGVAVSDRPSPDDGLSAADLATKYGLAVSGARPGLAEYVRQLWGRRHFILAFSQAKLTAQYSQAKLGQLWQVATPLLNAGVYYLIFGLILKANRGMSHDVYIPFLVTGVFVFTFTQSSIMAGVRAISGNLGLVRALHFPRASLPISFALQQLQQLLFSMIVLFVVAIGFGSYPSASWLLIVPVLVLQFLFNVGLSLIVARMGAKTPDLAQLMPFILRTWMYASGVMFSISTMLAGRPEWIARALQANPAAVYMDLMRYALIDGYGSSNLPPHVWAIAVFWAVVVALGGFVYFWKAEERYGRG
ncbi:MULTISPECIES: ABC transporter permease [unclassified Streptomyces]|uniref:ABC transporter permease n=1 Tax=unclassified Streptomyces TaxID=2593676 RepID=UPI002E816EF2|nr:ABC transporter permease [Streptomyces sp. NBC_00589]WTI34482.1 ABC transporter permease [Streptomyces sp. NBC_00775]WUB31846.1 ABC transporter permease [Streptomyces sp. NBC_00589]